LPGDFTKYAGGITESAGSVTIESNLVANGAFTQTGGTVSLLGGNLTTSVAAAFGTGVATYYANSGGFVDGAGTLATKGATSISDPGYYANGIIQNGTAAELTLGGGVSWVNSGTVSDGGAIYVGDASGLTASITNTATGVFNFNSDDGAIFNANVSSQLGSSSFSNAGTLAKTAGHGTNTVASSMTDTGKIAVAIGTIDFTNGGDFAGAISGAGTIQSGGGAAVIDAGASFTIGQILLTGGSAEIASSQSYGGVFTETGGDLAIDDGVTVTLSNYGYFSGGSVDGSGSLAVTGELDLAGVKLSNSAVSVSSTGDIIGYGTIGPAVANAGKIEATGGTLVIGGAVTGAGALQIDPNAEIELQAATAQAVNFHGPGGVLWLDQSVTYSGTIGGLGAGDTIVLGNTQATAAVFNSGKIDVTLAGSIHEMLAVAGGGVGLSLSLSHDTSGNSILAVGQV
jgi:hypothetical protein